MMALADSSVTGAAEDDDAVLEQAGVDVVGALAAAGLFDDDGNQCVAGHVCFVASAVVSRLRQSELRFLPGRGSWMIFPPPTAIGRASSRNVDADGLELGVGRIKIGDPQGQMCAGPGGIGPFRPASGPGSLAGISSIIAAARRRIAVAEPDAGRLLPLLAIMLHAQMPAIPLGQLHGR